MSRKEEWRDLPGYNGFYQASSLGRLCSFRDQHHKGQRLKAPVILKPTRDAHGSHIVIKWEGKQRTIQVCKAVALAFLGDIPKGWVAYHRDGNPENNTLSNIDIAPRSELSQERMRRKVAGWNRKPVLKIGRDLTVAEAYPRESRPAEVKERETFGHWEMDSVMGCKGSKAALVVLTERLTRYGLIFRVADHTMASVVKVLDKLERKLGKNFREVFQTITVDNGSEFQDCDGMQKSLRNRKPRTTIYYCHPYSASERGSNENMNRIIRRFFPKGTNFDEVTAAEVAQAETWMNDYPRAILGWRSAGALFAENIPQ